MSKSPWKTLNTEVVFSNKWMKLIRNDVIHPNGNKGEYTYMNAIPGVVIIAYEDNSIYLIQEYKYPIDKWIWNLITGGISDGLEPLNVAKDELREEANITANKWLSLGNFYTAPGIEITDNFTFLATELIVGDSQNNGEGDEAINQVRKVPMDEIKDMIMKGEIDNGIALAALMKFFTYIESHKIK